ncbi:MAG TPA: nitroreductase family protein [Thermodesulfobacteriota bacterium]
MELYDVMRTTFSTREFTDDPMPDPTLFKILDNARFAPSGGNRQGWRVIIIRKQETREALAQLTIPAAKRYSAQIEAGENPWNTVDPTNVDARTIELTPAPSHFTKPYLQAAVVLVVCVDLKVVASMDQYLNRVGVVSGASIYPFIWNILLAARHEGYSGTITTLAISQEPKLQELLGIPEHFAVSAIIPLGKPVKHLTRLKRKPVSSFATFEHWNGKPLAEVSDE